MDKCKYLNILKENMLKNATKLGLQNNCYFQQANNSKLQTYIYC